MHASNRGGGQSCAVVKEVKVLETALRLTAHWSGCPSQELPR